MDPFSSLSSAGSSPPQPLSADDFKNELKTEIARALAQGLVETERAKCFEKCISQQESSLDRGESSCISRCVDRYIEATGIIKKITF